jgi:hypothetical protein
MRQAKINIVFPVTRIALLVLLPAVYSMSVPSFAQVTVPQVVYDAASGREQQLTLWKYTQGDDPAWSRTDFQDSAWTTISKEAFYPETRGIHWLRTKILFKEGARRSPVIVRLGRIQSAFEVYWNGTLIGKNGSIGTRKEDEEPGQLHFAALVDTLVKPGINVLSVRFSNFHQVPPGSFFYAKVESTLYPSLLSLRSFIRMASGCAIYLACAIFGLALYLSGGRYRNFIYYVLLSLAFLVSSGFQFAMHYYNISMGVLEVFEPIFVGGYYLAELSIVLFVLFSFQIPHRNTHALSAVLFTFLIYTCFMIYDFDSPVGFGALRDLITPYTYGLLIYSCLKRKSGSVIALVGYGIYSLPVLLTSYLGIPFSFDLISPREAIILVYVMVANRQVHEQQMIQKSVELRSQRLETELLKKTIQPHFIMNTLASIRSLAKRRPEDAERLINALAAEFRIINSIASEQEIGIQQELELCDQHLQVMGYRWDARYTFIKENIDESLTVPPLIFHTLIENGLTHAFNPKENGTFRLSMKKENDCVEYTLQNDGSLLRALEQRPQQEVEEGTGIKYVKTRLEERYPGQWRLQYGLVDSHWNVVITICGGAA